jgi:hypothetical protein
LRRNLPAPKRKSPVLFLLRSESNRTLGAHTSHRDISCTIAIPVYNRVELARRAIESALAQHRDDIEILVVDDCSTDGAWEAVSDYSDNRFRAVRNDKRLGLFGNFNRCLALARGKYIRILCTDDRLPANSLDYELELMEANPDVALLSTRGIRIGADGNECGHLADHLLPGKYSGAEAAKTVLWVLSHYAANPLNYPSGILIRHDAVEAAGFFDESFELVGDLDFWFRILSHGKLGITDHIGCQIMLHGGQAGDAVFRKGRYIEEWCALADRWSASLVPDSLCRQIRKQMAACALWAASYFLRQGNSDVARLYWRSATTKGVSSPGLVLAFIRFVVLQVLLRTARIRLQPPVNRELMVLGT